MLVITRREQESIIFGDGQIKVKILRLSDGEVKLGIEAPRDISIHREEIFNRIKRGEGNLENGRLVINDGGFLIINQEGKSKDNK